MTIEDDVKKLITDNALDLTRVLIKQATEESDVKTAMYLLNKVLPNYTKPEPQEPTDLTPKKSLGLSKETAAFIRCEILGMSPDIVNSWNDPPAVIQTTGNDPINPPEEHHLKNT